MERLDTIINKLIEQRKQNETPEKLLVTTHMLLAELQQLNSAKDLPASKKVAVVLPFVLAHVNGTKNKNGDSMHVKKENLVSEQNHVIKVLDKPLPVAGSNGNTFNGFDPVRDIPTLAHQKKEGTELNESIGNRGESLNDKLKASNKEIGAILHHTPVRDLRKAIGINDRYLFINELFRGDEVMYERSIKTINSYTILPEAEYWISRELKTKLGWNDHSETVQHFDQLIRRRFS